MAAFFDVLARESELYGYPPAHRLIIDAYAVQHPRSKEWQEKLNIKQRFVHASIQSIAIHLIALYVAIEKQIDLPSIAKVMDKILKNMGERGETFQELKPPKNLGSIKINDVKEAFFARQCTLDEYSKLAWNWGQESWNAWKEHHDTVQKWYKEYSG